MKFSVTNHALARWRERCAIHADEKVDSLLAKLDEAVQKQGAPYRDSLCFYKTEDGILFLVKANQRYGTVITVINEKDKPSEAPVYTPETVGELKPLEVDYSLYYEPILAGIPNVIDQREYLKRELNKATKQQRKWLEAKMKQIKEDYNSEIAKAKLFEKLLVLQGEELDKELAVQLYYACKKLSQKDVDEGDVIAEIQCLTQELDEALERYERQAK